MDRLKKSRGPIRSTVTRTVNAINAELANADIDKDNLKVLFKTLETAQTDLEEINQKVLDAMLDDNCPEADLEAETTVAVDYQQKIQLAVVKAEKILDPVPPRPSSPSESTTSSKKNNFKLPKVELKKFNGELKEWLTFWSQFEKIHLDDDLHTTDKFQYLAQSMV